MNGRLQRSNVGVISAAVAVALLCAMTNAAHAQFFGGNGGMPAMPFSPVTGGGGGMAQGMPQALQQIAMLRALQGGGHHHGVHTGIPNPIFDPMSGQSYGQGGMPYGQGMMGQNGMGMGYPGQGQGGMGFGQGGMMGNGGMGMGQNGMGGMGQPGMGQGGLGNGPMGFGANDVPDEDSARKKASIERRTAARLAREQQQQAAKEKALETKRAKLATPAKPTAKVKDAAS